MTDVLQVDGLLKWFGDHRVLAGVDLAVPAGTITAVVGASGCGKTTLLRVVAGFEKPDAGTVRIAGREVAGPRSAVAPHRRGVGYVAQDGALFPHLTAGQNIAYGLRGGGAATGARVAELLDMVSLDASFAARRPHELSGGQQQRVALARALARQPKLMLLDEPFSALDTGLRAATRKTVARTLAEAGVTALLVTHDQEEAFAIADQVAVMRDGAFVQVGTPQQVYREPADRRTAEFLGECVFLAGQVGGGVADTVLGRIPVPGGHRGAATVLLRPEQLTAIEVADTDREAGTGTVVAAEFLGSDVLLTVTPHGGESPVTIRQASIDAPPVDAKVRIEVRGSGVVVSDEASAAGMG
ncbi:ABC transporter ATP-binding protein [Mycobacterium sp. MYCO198283]|uniref:ABC transporter ATP-binding protein n=1 Tax=Mycobacterium sp. MYCO198283 TaxID=2883505 RepID=UPI001E3AAAE3|nr:ABC transporter ATP-binding protein [Mycobacterium sp. MYCO198283]MCG5433158.1 ABC transporter ATP-binding protein [Mycobacterium sp. MYCO198283]